jgi:hypothetical protein
MCRRSRSELELMLARAELSISVAYPRDTFCDVVTMAHAAASEQDSPVYTHRRLETLLFDCATDDVVHFDSAEFAALVKQALKSARR